LVWLDSAATTQKPRAVLDAMNAFCETRYANVHRGVHTLGQAATDAYEGARATVARFIGANAVDEVVFVRGATEAINLVAASFGRTVCSAGDEVVVTELEHHSNIVPWQLLSQATGAVLRVVPMADDGTVELSRIESVVGPRTRLVAVTHVSNVLGTVLPIEAVAKISHAAGARVLVDGCQATAHFPLDVRALDVDFYAFSAHKMYGPTGIGALWGRGELLRDMPPYQGGGEMIASVTFAETRFKKPPHRFEAGTPPIVEAIGLGAAIDYLSAIGLANAHAHEDALLATATRRLSEIEGLRIIGTAPEKAAIVSFVMDGVHPHDIGTLLDGQGIAVRTGHHCAQPLHDHFGLGPTTRASFALYNTPDEVERLVAGVARALETMR